MAWGGIALGFCDNTLASDPQLADRASGARPRESDDLQSADDGGVFPGFGRGGGVTLAGPKLAF